MDSNEAGRLLRQLIPYPGAADAIPAVAMSPLSPAGYQAREGSASSGAFPAAGREAASSIVAEAASILDEEMAKGVLAARSHGPSPGYSRPDSNAVGLRQLHDLIDNIAKMWPSLPGASGLQSAASPPTTNDAPDALPELRPRSSARRGERAVIQMALCNKEDRPVRLTPVATDLLNSKGDRIACRLLQFAPNEVQIGPGDQRDLEITVAVPLDARPGCYAGLLVVTGVEYLRALIRIEVV